MNIKNKKTSSYVWQCIKYRPVLYFITTLLWIIKDIIPLIQGIIVKEFFAIVEGKSSMKISICGLLFFIVIITLLRVFIIQLGFRTSMINKFSISSLLRRNMLNSVIKKVGAKGMQTSVGEIINSFRDDVEQVESSINWLSWLIGQIIFGIVAIIILLKINVKMTLLVFIPLVAVIVLAQKFEKKIEMSREQSRNITSRFNGTLGEIFESVLAIKVSGEEKNIINNLKDLSEKRHKLMLKDSLLTQVIDSIYNNAVILGTGLILFISAGEIKAGNFGVGDLAVFVYYLSFVADSIESTGNFLVHFKQTGVAFKRMRELIQSKDGDELVKHKTIYLKSLVNNNMEDYVLNEKDINKYNNSGDLDNKTLKKLEVKNLTYCYENCDNGIHNINFSLNRGEVTVVCGRTGSGKTTLLKTLLGLLPANYGNVYWNENRIESSKDFFIPPISAYTSQVPNLFSDTVRNNILLGLDEKEVDLEGAINSAVLQKDIDELENGLDTVIGPKGVKLSGGQLQRVAVGRMFVRNPQLLVFDDISSALDVETEKILWSRLFKEHNHTCIIVSNRRFALEQANNVIVMKDGKIEAQGKLKDLLKDCMEIQKILTTIRKVNPPSSISDGNYLNK